MKLRLEIHDDNGEFIQAINAPTFELLEEKWGAYERNLTNHGKTN